jgi:hypothetical protein
LRHTKYVHLESTEHLVRARKALWHNQSELELGNDPPNIEIDQSLTGSASLFVIARIGWYFPYASEILRRRPKPTPWGENCWNDLRRRGDCVIVRGLLERRCPVAALVSTAYVYGRLVARVLQQTAATINFRIVAEFPSGHWCRTVTTRAHVLVLLAFPAVSRVRHF